MGLIISTHTHTSTGLLQVGKLVLMRSVEIVENQDKIKVKYRHCARFRFHPIVWPHLQMKRITVFTCEYECPLSTDRGQMSGCNRSLSPGSLWGDTEPQHIHGHRLPVYDCSHGEEPTFTPPTVRSLFTCAGRRAGAVTSIVLYKDGHFKPEWNCTVKLRRTGWKIAGNVLPPSAEGACGVYVIIQQHFL